MGDFVLLYAILLYCALFGGEFYLSRLPKRWPGLILPVFTFCMAMVNVISYANTGYGNVIVNFFSSNVITFALLLMYFYQRQKIEKGGRK